MVGGNQRGSCCLYGHRDYCLPRHVPLHERQMNGLLCRCALYEVAQRSRNCREQGYHANNRQILIYRAYISQERGCKTSYGRTDSAYNIHMHTEQWIVALSFSGGVLLGLAAVFFPVRRLHLAVLAAVLLLLSLYEIRVDQWEKTVTAPIRLDIFAEIPLMILCLIFGVWQIVLCRRRRAR